MSKLTYSVNEASEALSLGRTKIYRLIAEGKIPTVKVGSRTLIPVEGLEEYISSLGTAT